MQSRGDLKQPSFCNHPNYPVWKALSQSSRIRCSNGGYSGQLAMPRSPNTDWKAEFFCYFSFLKIDSPLCRGVGKENRAAVTGGILYVLFGDYYECFLCLSCVYVGMGTCVHVCAHVRPDVRHLPQSLSILIFLIKNSVHVCAGTLSVQHCYVGART